MTLLQLQCEMGKCLRVQQVLAHVGVQPHGKKMLARLVLGAISGVWGGLKGKPAIY